MEICIVHYDGDYIFFCTWWGDIIPSLIIMPLSVMDLWSECCVYWGHGWRGAGGDWEQNHGRRLRKRITSGIKPS